MQYEVPVNMSSLDLVSTELAATLDEATDAFEEYISDTDKLDKLKDCAQLSWQIAGTLDLIQVPGAALLARNIEQALQSCCASGRGPNEKQAEALSTSLFVLPRYLESVASRQSDIAVILLPQVNELRAAHGKEPLYEHAQLGLKLPQFSREFSLEVPVQAGTPDQETLKRLRHMYQVGLLGVLRDSQVSLHLRLMFRAVQRLCALIPPGEAQRFWLLGNAVLDAFQERRLAINSTRRRIFTVLDKAFRSLSSDPQKLTVVPDAPACEQEMLYLLQISDSAPESIAGRLLKAADIAPLDVTDRDMQVAMQRMFGPGLDAMSTVIRELREELRNATDMLEILMQSGRTDEEEVAPLCQILVQLGGILQVLGLPTLARYARAQADQARALKDMDHTATLAALPNIADAILFIQHSLDNLERNPGAVEDLDDLTPDRQLQISSMSQLETSRLLVFKESESGISLAKRAISAYVDSDYDIAHIYNVGTTLNSIRGAFHVLTMGRITRVLTAAVTFVNDFVEKRDMRSPDKAKLLLETLADALISVEYYLTELSRHHRADEELLSLAEESLKALGYQVKPA
ncbi:hypothetical protein FHR99_000687 [Litorivivens lipolytica]|uniref:Scaffold protein FimL second domain-containing protein n=1 Tax=Litorivivens lipolytica TaxID=1524264 RepID=A0A7W4W2W2_9GAMM|nr:hypothetical protein [Litorivivens lipolytica]MBB3046451.1 hypothetical protein [Litorivivens lipolytica]